MSAFTATRLRAVTATAPAAPKVPKPRSASWRRKINRQRVAAYAIATVALVLTALSLSHLAAGVALLTGSATWHAWAMSIGIDFAFIGLELGQLCVTTDKLRKEVARFAGPAVKGTLIASALMNAYAFAVLAPNVWFAAAGCALGCAIPALIYVLARISVAMWIDAHRI